MVVPRGRTTVHVAVVLLVIVAIAMSAATITALEGGAGIGLLAPDGGGPGDQGPGVDTDPSDPVTGDHPDPIFEGITQVCIPWLQSLRGILGVLALVLAALGAVYWRYNFSTAFLSGNAIVPPVSAAYFFLTNCASGGTGGGGVFHGIVSDVIGTTGGSAGGIPIPPEYLVFAALGVVAVAALAMAVVVREPATVKPEIDRHEAPTVNAAAFAGAAGRAADRIEAANAPVDNAVYRAWLEMTRLLQLTDAETTTPREFANRAVEVGLAKSDVEELTALFTEVRYGGQAAELREGRAVEILRTVQASYGPGTESGDDHGEGTLRNENR